MTTSPPFLACLPFHPFHSLRQSKNSQAMGLCLAAYIPPLAIFLRKCISRIFRFVSSDTLRPRHATLNFSLCASDIGIPRRGLGLPYIGLDEPRLVPFLIIEK